jgi:hypothetical protein
MAEIQSDWVRFNAQTEGQEAIDIQNYDTVRETKSWYYTTINAEYDQDEAAAAVATAMNQFPDWMREVFLKAAELITPSEE